MEERSGSFEPSRLYELVPPSNPAIRTRTEDFDFSSPPVDPAQLAVDVSHAMLRLGGLGLSANQLGLPYRMFVVKSSPILAVFNPRVVDSSAELVEMEEGCLTWPGVFLSISRPREIRARWTMANGETVTHKYSGMTSRVFQHELDHLNGVTFLDRVSRLKRQMALDKRRSLI